MATYKNGINGPFKGKLGNVVGVTWMGLHIMRSLPEASSKAPTAAQIEQRNLLAMVSSWLRPLKELIGIGFQYFTKGKSSMNSAISLVMREALIIENGQRRIDYPKAIFSRGDLLISIIREIITLVNTLLHIKWDNASLSALNNENDRATFILYNESKEQFATFAAVAQRGDKEVLLQLPASFAGDSAHLYMHYVNEKEDAMSTTVYLGEVLV